MRENERTPGNKEGVNYPEIDIPTFHTRLFVKEIIKAKKMHTEEAEGWKSYPDEFLGFSLGLIQSISKN